MTASASNTYRFEGFRLDPAIRELRHGAGEILLPPKAFGCLVYLIENRDRAVGRDELISAVWGRAELANSVPRQAIIDVRRALECVDERREYIKTVRGFGYRWVPPVVVETAGVSAVGSDGGWRRFLSAPALSLIAAAGAVLVLGAAGWWFLPPPDDGGSRAAAHGRSAGIGLLLPVVVEAGDHDRWVRFGAMELMAERLRAAGQPMVPSETVIALVQGFPAEPDTAALERLASSTGAGMILQARAESTEAGWRISLQNFDRGSAPRVVTVEADDIIYAARTAADELILSLGLTPPPEPESRTELALLLQQVEAARLAQQMDRARSLIDAAEPVLRAHPEIRLQQARIDLFSHNLERARAALESLLEDTSQSQETDLRARILNDLGRVHIRQTDYDAAEIVLQQAASMLDPRDMPAIVGQNRNYLGTVAIVRGDFVLALEYMAQARNAFEATGDTRGLAMLDNNLGVLEAMHDRHVAARSYFERAAEARAALNSVGEELRACSNLVHAQLNTLDPAAALELEPRLHELIGRTTNPEIVANGNISRVSLLFSNGRLRAAWDVLDETLSALEHEDSLFNERVAALIWQAELLEHDGQYEQAAEKAAQVVEQVVDEKHLLLGGHLGRAWLLLLRARIGERDWRAASEIVAAVEEWAADSAIPSPRIYATLAAATLAVAEDRPAAAIDAFEYALALSDPGQAPRRFLQVAEPYVAWLVSAPATSPGPERALVIADRMARYAEQDYRAALLQLRVYHALGPPAAWQAALERAAALAGEREIPTELLAAPATRQYPDRNPSDIRRNWNALASQIGQSSVLDSWQ